jgi:hypothetical protein
MGMGKMGMGKIGKHTMQKWQARCFTNIGLLEIWKLSWLFYFHGLHGDVKSMKI